MFMLWSGGMIDYLDNKELQLILFLCMARKNVVGLEECKKEGTHDLYSHVCALLREEDND